MRATPIRTGSGGSEPIGREAARIGIVAADPVIIEPLVAGLLPELARQGHAVDCFAPFGGGLQVRRLAALGARVHAIELHRSGIDPGAQIRSLASLSKALREAGSQALLGLGLNGSVFASLAGRMLGIGRVISLIDQVVLEPPAGRGLMARVRRETTRRLFRMALSRSHAAIFYHRDDPSVLARAGVLPRHLAVHVVGGAGLNLADVREMALPAISDGLTFLMAAPLERARGVETFLAAARLMLARGVRAKWLLYGPDGEGRDAISRDDISRSAGPVVCLGPELDLESVFSQSHVLVLPATTSGSSDVALQGLAVARPVIASDVVGLRDIVDEGVNGILVPPGDEEALVGAMTRLLKRPDLIPSMALASRRKAERLYDVRLANRLVIEALDLGRVGRGGADGLRGAA